MTGALLVVLAIAGAWIGILHRQVGERTKQLRQEIAEHEKTEARLAEETRRVQAEIQERTRMEAEVEKGHKQLLKASRLAGMAEVATSVLHNVGNVLNSANVLGSSILEHVQRSDWRRCWGNTALTWAGLSPKTVEARICPATWSD